MSVPLLLWGPENPHAGCTHVAACSVLWGLELAPGRVCRLLLCLAAVLNTLRHLSTTTSILTDPAQLPEQAAEAVTRMGQRSGES